MTKYELQQYYWLKLNLQKLEEMLLELETKATKQTTSLSQDKVSSSNNDDKLSAIVAKIIDIQNLINSKVGKAYTILNTIEQTIEQLPEREKYLMRARYIECKSWEQIAVDMHYSWQWIHKIHSRALKILAESKEASKRDAIPC